MRAWMKIPNLEKEARAYIIKVAKLAASPLGRVFPVLPRLRISFPITPVLTGKYGTTLLLRQLAVQYP